VLLMVVVGLVDIAAYDEANGGEVKLRAKTFHGGGYDSVLDHDNVI
jgi:hypothetical protein